MGFLTSFFKYLTKRYLVSEKRVVFYRLLPPSMALGVLTSSSDLIFLPVCCRKMSSRVGDEKLTDESRMPLLSNALTDVGDYESRVLRVHGQALIVVIYYVCHAFKALKNILCARFIPSAILK